MNDDGVPIFCDRCTKQLEPGQGDFFVIKIEATADPSPPRIDDPELLNLDHKREIQRIVHDVEKLSARELMDQVHRRLTIYLCNACYRDWIEDPTGS